MLLREEKPQPKQQNPYEWPKSYYMETDPKERWALLCAQDQEENPLLAELFQRRYEKQKKGDGYADVFLRNLLELIFISKNLGGSFATKKNKKQALDVVRGLCLDQADHFGTDLLYKELRHLIAVYIVDCMNDRRYCSILLDFGKMKEEKVRKKVRQDVDEMIIHVPQELGMTKEFELLTRAGLEAVNEMGIC